MMYVCHRIILKSIKIWKYFSVNIYGQNSVISHTDSFEIRKFNTNNFYYLFLFENFWKCPNKKDSADSHYDKYNQLFSIIIPSNNGPNAYIIRI